MEQNLKVVLNLFNDFSNSIDNRTFFFFHYSKEVFSQILDWHFIVWCEDQYYHSDKKNLSVAYQYFQIEYILNSIIIKIEETTLKQEENYLIFQCFKDHVEKYKEHYIEVYGTKRYYAEDLLKTFYNVLFDTTVDLTTRLYIWEDQFPSGWKITRNNIVTERIAKISLNRFLVWAQERIRNPEKEYDDKLDDVVKNLFPDVEPTIWAKILIFVLSPYGENRLRSVIKRRWNFGHIGRIITYSGSTENSEEDFDNRVNEMIRSERERETRNTFELGCYIFRDQFSKEDLQKYLEELNKIEYQKDSDEEHKRMKLLNIFSGMLEFLDQKVKPAKEQP